MDYKLVALAKHLSLSYLIWEDEIYYNVSLGEFNELSGSNYEEIEEIAVDNKPFLKYLKNEGSIFSNDVEINDDYYTFENEEYLICTDEEADVKWDEYLENYIEECVLPEIPETYRCYFNNEAFKSDCEVDGRGQSLSSYDGEEIEIRTEEEVYYIYRTN